MMEMDLKVSPFILSFVEKSCAFIEEGAIADVKVVVRLSRALLCAVMPASKWNRLKMNINLGRLEGVECKGGVEYP